MHLATKGTSSIDGALVIFQQVMLNMFKLVFVRKNELRHVISNNVAF